MDIFFEQNWNSSFSVIKMFILQIKILKNSFIKI